MQFKVFPYTIAFSIACIIDLIALLLVMIKPHFSGKKWLVLEFVAILFWNFCIMLASTTVNFSDRLVWAKLAYLGTNSVSPLLLLFFMNYPVAKFNLSSRNKVLLFIIPLITTILVFTNDLHHLYWTGFTLASVEMNTYYFGHGVFYWFTLIYNYSCGFACILLMFSIFRNYKGLFRIQAIILLISSAIPFIAGLVYSFAGGLLPGLDYLPLAYSLAGIGLVVCVIFFRMLDIVPIGRNLMIEKMQVGLIVIDEKNRIVDINPAARDLLSNHEIKIGDMIEKTGPAISYNLIHNVPNAEIEIVTDQTRFMDLSTTVLETRSGRALGRLAILRDVTENHQLRKQLQELATHDPLTGLPNRRLFLDRIDRAIADARRKKQKLAILSLDLDNFKETNDLFGHAFGDQVLIETGRRITKSVREMDTVSRFGGDEFMILLKEIHTNKDVEVVVNKMIGSLHNPIDANGEPISIRASIGIAIYPDDAKQPQDLISRSDQALYAIKTSGKDNFKFFGEPQPELFNQETW